eukprot:13698-Heterococcus_DN1.PRE.2
MCARCTATTTATAASATAGALLQLLEPQVLAMSDSPRLKLALKLALLLVLPATAEYAQNHRLQCFKSYSALWRVTFVLWRSTSSSSRRSCSDSSLVAQSFAPSQQAVWGHYTSAQQLLN